MCGGGGGGVGKEYLGRSELSIEPETGLNWEARAREGEKGGRIRF